MIDQQPLPTVETSSRQKRISSHLFVPFTLFFVYIIILQVVGTGILAYLMLTGHYSFLGAVAIFMLCGTTLCMLFFYKRYLWDLRSIVYDCGEELLVFKSGQRLRLPMREINAVETAPLFPYRRGRSYVVTLHLQQPSVFGQSITFIPLDPFPHYIQKMLMQRIHATQGH